MQRYFSRVALKYGCNPHQRAYMEQLSSSVVKVVSGTPSLINILDAIYSWDLVNTLHQCRPNKLVSTSFKHNIPTGVSMLDKSKYTVQDSFEDSRSIDPLSSFGDFIALSDTVDAATARQIQKVVSDGIIAPDYTTEALEILQQKKQGNYIVCQGCFFTPTPEFETREVMGLRLKAESNSFILNDSVLDNVVASSTEKHFGGDSPTLSEATRCSLIAAFNCLKNVVSNSVAVAHDGKVIAVASGQQNRVDCIRLAGQKTRKYLRQHNISKEATSLVLASDGFLPFEDNVEECAKYNIDYIVQPGGSIRDQVVSTKSKDYNIHMFHTGTRMFFH